MEIFPFVSEKEIWVRWKNLRTCCKRELDAQKNVTSLEGRRKRHTRKYLYFDQLLLLLPHPEDRWTQINLITQRNEIEEETNSLQEEEDKELPQNVRRKIQTKISYEESLLQILWQKKIEDTDVDEDKCFLLSVLPSFRQFNKEQKFMAGMEILKIMW